MVDEYTGHDEDEDYGSHGGDGSLTRVTYGEGPLESLAVRDYANPIGLFRLLKSLQRMVLDMILK